ncbi:MAG TPA: L-histidine N(alpha)-methyltransferase [Bacteroidales bacterium]|nr:L-histidine N(alpha)-methyltransferase [Bacteroidales bacterium]
MDTLQVKTIFSEDIRTGLSSFPRYIPSKYFYDDEGSRIFQKIMRMPEYYLTDCEYEIFRDNARDFYELINPDNRRFDLIELGAGDGLKTSLLISHCLEVQARFKYVPIDISVDALLNLVKKLRLSFPGLVVSEIAGDYFEVLNDLNFCDDCRKVNLFLGSNIGNYSHGESVGFFRQLSSVLNPGDIVITGFDLVKSPDIILDAYNDPHGYTRDFNLNLLSRMNYELGADFNPSNFIHTPVYDPAEQTAKSFLVSTRNQDVHFEALDFTAHFNKWESIRTEISRKFTFDEIDSLAEKTGFRPLKNFTDKKEWYVNALWKKI